MMISQPAWWCLETTWLRLWRRPLAESDAGHVPDPPPGAAMPARMSEDAPSIEGIVAAEAAPAPDARRSPTSPGGPDAPLTAAERRARAAALRALALSRGRRFDAARDAFTDAALLDPTLDLTRTPTFWKLERAAHEAAIDAYDAAGRDRDAAVLRARVRSTFRPRALRPRQEAVLSP
jgi:hypothetical protein